MSEDEIPLRKILSYFGYDSSHAFLARMESNPNWPPWIPIKTEP